MSTKIAAALVFVALSAFAASSGASGSTEAVCTARAEECMTDAEFRALTIRSQALNRKYGLGG